jgi:thymidylate kinase
LTFLVLYSGPCGGKSSALKHFSETLRNDGYHIYTSPEVPTIMIGGGCVYPGENGDREQLLAFEENLINLQYTVENVYANVASSTGKPSVVIYDRGLMDPKAYMSEEVWNEVLKRGNWKEDDFLKEYDLVIHLTTAAKGAEQFYTLGNNHARTESIDQARALDDRILEAWKHHPKRFIIDNSTDFNGKIEKVTEIVVNNVHDIDPRKPSPEIK